MLPMTKTSNIHNTSSASRSSDQIADSERLAKRRSLRFCLTSQITAGAVKAYALIVVTWTPQLRTLAYSQSWQTEHLPFNVAPQGALCCCLAHRCSLYGMLHRYCLAPFFIVLLGEQRQMMWANDIDRRVGYFFLLTEHQQMLTFGKGFNITWKCIVKISHGF